MGEQQTIYCGFQVQVLVLAPRYLHAFCHDYARSYVQKGGACKEQSNFNCHRRSFQSFILIIECQVKLCSRRSQKMDQKEIESSSNANLPVAEMFGRSLFLMNKRALRRVPSVKDRCVMFSLMMCSHRLSHIQKEDERKQCY